MADTWSDYEPPKPVNAWDEYTPGVEVAEPEQPKVTGTQLLKNSAESMWNATKGIASDAFDFERDLATGAFKMPTEVTGAVLGFGEDFATDLINVGNVMTGQPQRPKENTVSDWVKNTGRQGAEMIRPDDQGTGGRIAEEIGSYALPSAGLTKMMISSGQLLKGAPRTLNMFENLLAEAAKNPKVTMALDQTISALMATVGQTSEEAGLSPTQRALLELSAGVVPAAIPGAVTKAKNLVGNTKFSKYAVGKYLNDVIGEDPLFWKTFKRMKGLSEKHGVKMDTPELGKNPELKAAQKALTEEAQGGATRELAFDAGSQNQVRSAFDYDPRITDKAIRNEADNIAKIETDLQTKINAVEKTAVKEAIPYKNASIKDAGDQALIALDKRETELTKALNKQYEAVGLDVPVKTGLVRGAISDARKSALPNNQWRGELDPHLKKVLDTLSGSKEDLTLGGMQELQGLLKSSIRTERAAGKDQLVRELSKVLDSTYKQLDAVTGLSKESVSTLKAANTQARLIHERFDDSRISILNTVDKQGVVKTASEDVIKNVIKPDTQSNSIRAVKAYQSAIGDKKKAKEILRNGFIAKLAANSLKKQTADGSELLLDPKSTANFLKQHKNFLEQSGLKGEFKDPASASKALESAQATLQESMSKIAKSELATWVKSDDPVKYVANAMKSGKIKTLLAQTKGKPLVQRGIRESAWESVLLDANATRGMAGLEQGLTVESLKTVFQKNAKNLRMGLGDAHFNDAKELMLIVDSITLKPTSTAGFATKNPIEGLTEKLFVGLRAAAHGFVRPDLIVAQMGKRGFDAIRLVESKKLLKEALVNPSVAKEMLKVYRSGKPGMEAVKATLAPFATSTAEIAIEE